jgi:hypothetical protein
MASAVPRLVKFAGRVGQGIKPAGVVDSGEALAFVGVTFAVYAEQEGGAALWQETQNVALDGEGRYSVLLGAASREGMPAELFATGEPRWLGVRVNVAGDDDASQEQARVLLVSVPYALRAADAETLGGRAASDFVLREELAGWSGIAAMGGVTPGAADRPRAVGGTQGVVSGTVNRLGKFTPTGADVGDSLMFDDGNGIGITTTTGSGFYTPVALLDLQLTTAVPRDTLSAAVVLNNAADISGSGVVTPFRMTLNDQSTGLVLSKQAMRVIYDRNAGASGNVSVFDSALTLATFFRSSAPYTYRGLNVEGARVLNGFTVQTLFGIFVEAPPATVGGQPAGTITNKFALVTAPGSGNVGIGTTGPTEQLEVAGNVRVVGNVVATGSIMGAGTASSFTAPPTGAGVGQGALFVNPGSAGADQTLFGVAVGGAQRFRVDSEGDVFGAGGSFSGTTTTTNSAILRATQGGASLTTAEFINPPPAAVRGETTTGTGFTAGVLGISSSADGIGVAGLVNGATSIGAYVENAASGAVFNWGVLSLAAAQGATAVQGEATSASGDAWGVNGISHSTLGIGVRGDATATSGATIGLYGFVNSVQGVGLYVENNAAGDLIIGAVGGSNKFKVTGAGNVNADGTYTSPAADFAESVEPLGKREDYAPGDVLIIDPTGKRRVTLSQQPYSARVAGIYSTKPAVLGGHEGADQSLVAYIPMAMVGIVPCKVSAENGPIAAGDLLVTSSVAGHAMRGTKRGRMLGAIVGKALESFDPRDAQGRPARRATGVIQVLVTLQ